MRIHSGGLKPYLVVQHGGSVVLMVPYDWIVVTNDVDFTTIRKGYDWRFYLRREGRVKGVDWQMLPDRLRFKVRIGSDFWGGYRDETWVALEALERL